MKNKIVRATEMVAVLFLLLLCFGIAEGKTIEVAPPKFEDIKKVVQISADGISWKEVEDVPNGWMGIMAYTLVDTRNNTVLDWTVAAVGPMKISLAVSEELTDLMSYGMRALEIRELTGPDGTIWKNVLVLPQIIVVNENVVPRQGRRVI